jgi:DNA mismatch repair protein MutS2
LSRQERDDRQRYRKQWQREFSKAQHQINQLVETLKKEKHLSHVQVTRRSMAAVDQHVKEQLPTSAVSSFNLPQSGDRVEIDEWGTVGILQESLEGKKQVAIRVGSQMFKVSPAVVRIASSSPSKSASTSQGRHAFSRSSPGSPIASMTSGFYQQEHDLRGIRLEDALEKTLAALDQALMDQAKYVKIIHGQGSGALKAGIRKLCESSPYTESFRAGDPAEGGDGVTIIELQ